jgi:hypothetical protein
MDQDDGWTGPERVVDHPVAVSALPVPVSW